MNKLNKKIKSDSKTNSSHILDLEEISSDDNIPGSESVSGDSISTDTANKILDLTDELDAVRHSPSKPTLSNDELVINAPDLDAESLMTSPFF